MQRAQRLLKCERAAVLLLDDAVMPTQVNPSVCNKTKYFRIDNPLKAYYRVQHDTRDMGAMEHASLIKLVV